MFRVLAQGGGIGDVMVGIAPSGNLDISRGLPDLYDSNSYLYYADQGSSGSSYRTPWVNSLSNPVLLQQDYTLVLTRVGSVISYTLTGSNINAAGVVTNNLSTPVTPVVALYNGINFKLMSSYLE